MMLSKSFIALVFLALTTSVNANAAIAGLARQACKSPPLPAISERSAYYEKRIRKFPFLVIVVRE
jgi:hypothetical protein